MPTRLAVTGSTGRMGATVRRVAADRDDVEVTLAASRGADNSSEALVRDDELGAALRGREPDVLVDFTVPAASVEYVRRCADAGVPAVVGTTGFTDDQLDALRAASEAIPVLRAANFSRGVQVLSSLVAEAVRGLVGYDIEVTETHHNAKRDAPSGTAKRLLRGIEAVREGTERVHGRHGEAPRTSGEVGVHARRAGTIPGEHEVLLAGNHEVLRLVHRAENRDVFAIGALDAAVWLADREPGWYEFSDVIGSDTT